MVQDRNPDDPYHRVRYAGTNRTNDPDRLEHEWICLKCGALFNNEQAAEEHEANRGWES